MAQTLALARRHAATAILERRAQLIEVLTGQWQGVPNAEIGHDPATRSTVQRDAGYLLAHLVEALAHDRPILFRDYVAWARITLQQRGIGAADLARRLTWSAEALRDLLPPDLGEIAIDLIGEALTAMPDMPDALPSFLQAGAPLAPLAHDYFAALLRAERRHACRLVLDAVDRGAAIRDVYQHVFEPSQYEVGRLWQLNHITVAQEHYCTAATQLAMSQLYPQMFRGERCGRRLVATCVASDLHELGARMVADFFEMDGWDTYFTGAGTPHDAVVAAVVSQRAELLAISATLIGHVHEVARLIATVRAHAACAGVKILVGGYPFNRVPDLWRDVGADGSGANARQAVAVAAAWQRR